MDPTVQLSVKTLMMKVATTRAMEMEAKCVCLDTRTHRLTALKKVSSNSFVAIKFVILMHISNL